MEEVKKRNMENEVDEVKQRMKDEIARIEADIEAHDAEIAEKAAIKEKVKSVIPEKWEPCEEAEDKSMASRRICEEDEAAAQKAREAVINAKVESDEVDDDNNVIMVTVITEEEAGKLFPGAMKKKATVAGEGKAPRGESWQAIEKVLKEAGSKGLTAKEIEEKAGLTGGQVRGQTFTQKDKRLKNENGRWFLMG